MEKVWTPFTRLVAVVGVVSFMLFPGFLLWEHPGAWVLGALALLAGLILHLADNNHTQR